LRQLVFYGGRLVVLICRAEESSKVLERLREVGFEGVGVGGGELAVDVDGFGPGAVSASSDRPRLDNIA
jgi:hypothetical protein